MRRIPALLTVVALLSSAARAQSFGPWRVLGRFDYDSVKLRLAEALPPEKAAKGAPSLFDGPDFTATFKGQGGEPVAWRALGDAFAANALDCGAMDLNALAPPKKAGAFDSAVVYLHRKIDCEQALDLPVWVGSDDGLRLWLNGQLLVDADVPRGLTLQDDFVKLRLRAGANHLVAKVANIGGAYSFQMRAWEKVPQQAINDAIDRGCEFFVKQQLIDGSWGAWDHWGGGHAAFVAYTLLKCGVPRSHPAVRKALTFLRERPLDTVYSISCAILALEAAAEPGDRGLLEDLVARLLDMQDSTGLYDYPVYPDGQRPPVDMSNTLYAALALRAARKAEVSIPDDVWAKLAGGSLRCFESPREVLEPDGSKRKVAGFSYRMKEGVAGSTTTAGLSVLAICEEFGARSMPTALKGRINAAKELALAWIEHELIWSVNPGQGAGHHYFWVYGLERVGGLLKLDKFGEVDWYWDGAAYLLKAQAGDGSWNPHNYVDHQYLDACLALLFLKKATAARISGEALAKANVFETLDGVGDLRLRATGDSQITIWISGLADSVAERAAKAGVLDIESVEYFARLEGEPGEAQSIGRVPGAPAKRAELQRFALRHAFPRRGVWSVSARLNLRVPSEAANEIALGAEARALESYDSPKLAVTVEVGAGPVRLDYASDLSRDLLFDVRGKFAASTQNNDAEAPKCVVDGALQTRWRCRPDEERPWLRLTLDRPIKAERLLLTHALPRPQHAAAARISKVDVLVNQKEHFLVDLDPDVLTKSTVEFGSTLLVRELEVRVLECRDRKLGTDPVGFAELELQRVR